MGLILVTLVINQEKLVPECPKNLKHRACTKGSSQTAHVQSDQPNATQHDWYQDASIELLLIVTLATLDLIVSGLSGITSGNS